MSEALAGFRPIGPSPDRSADNTPGQGPYRRMILRGLTVVDGTGAPPYGPVDLVIEGGTIAAVLAAGNATRVADAPEAWATVSADRVLDLTGHYVLPGLIDAHAHIATPEQAPRADYCYKLWLGHGVTTVRELGAMTNGFAFTAEEARRSQELEIVAPSIVPYVYFGHGLGATPTGERQACAWVQAAAEQGAAGVKFFGAPPKAMQAALQEAAHLGLGTACHHAQQDVARVNALATSRWGLRSVEHWYGLAEAMFTDRTVQHYRPDYNYLDEAVRFGVGAEVWQQCAEPGSARWDAVLDELLSLGTTLVPTFNIYIATRDAARTRASEWHADYTAPQLESFFTPSPRAHGSFFSDWGTEQEVAWRHAYQKWMQLVRDFHQRGGRVAAGSDSGFIYKVYGFGLVEELELLREAGLHPLEVIRAATLSGAELLGIDDVTGSIEPGKRADLLIVEENPLANLKLLYGHGHLRYSPEGLPYRTGGVKLTVREGIVYDAARLRADVRAMVQDERARQKDIVLAGEDGSTRQ
ncbi:amidohydrolase family protein [Microtetraspora fusca]|uniref:amidohydrolase family protein n=1 Tax=Microtetraspora fusca TaxID=1997 RepID=UPI000836C7FC|nr:amidohydrolase family protein [Microtetraspora fusca]